MLAVQEPAEGSAPAAAAAPVAAASNDPKVLLSGGGRGRRGRGWWKRGDGHMFVLENTMN